LGTDDRFLLLTDEIETVLTEGRASLQVEQI